MSELAHFNGFDYLLIIILIISTLLGFLRGFLSETISLLTWIAAFIVSFIFAGKFTLFVHQYIADLMLAKIIAFAILFLVVLIIGGIINYTISKLLYQTTGVGAVDHLFGGIFGFLRGVVILLFIIFLISNTSWQNKTWLKQSVCVEHLQGLSSWLQQRGAEVLGSSPAIASEKQQN